MVCSAPVCDMVCWPAPAPPCHSGQLHKLCVWTPCSKGHRSHVYCPASRCTSPQSDAYRIHVCEKSGLIAVANLKKQQFTSQIYKNESTIVQVRFQGFGSKSVSCLVASYHRSLESLSLCQSAWGS